MTDSQLIPRPARSVLSFSREYELATESELVKRMGCARDKWLPTLVKELIDNALDACEEAGVAPQITIEDSQHRFTVSDNGPGLDRELVAKLCDLSQRTSTREAYATPDRGSQGNALPTLLALPFGFGHDIAMTTIVSRGIEHVITLRADRLAQRITVEHTERPVPVEPGAAITITWPGDIHLGEVIEILYRYALLNRHARFRLVRAGNEHWSAGPWGPPLTKWTPGLPIPPHWYTLERFTHRVLLEIRRDPEITVAQFLGTFKGLSSPPRRSELAEAAGLSYQPLRALLDQSGTQLDQVRAARLLTAMQKASRAPKPAVLGAAGEVAFAAWVKSLAKRFGSNPDQSPSGGLPFFTYSTIDGVIEVAEIPYRWELGICHLPGLEESALLVAQNFSPSCQPELMMKPVFAYVYPWALTDPNQSLALFAHRITPARASLDYGKASLDIGSSEAIAVSDALEKIGKPWVKYAEAKDRGKTPALPGVRPPERMTIKDAVEQVLPEAYAEASSDGQYPTTPRQLYYRVRPKVLELTGKTELGYGYFGADLLPRYLQEHAELVAGWRIHFKARGTLLDPSSTVAFAK